MCQAGKGPNADYTDCMPCGAGTYKDTVDHTCKPCPIHHFSSRPQHSPDATKYPLTGSGQPNSLQLDQAIADQPGDAAAMMPRESLTTFLWHAPQQTRISLPPTTTSTAPSPSSSLEIGQVVDA